MNKFYLLKSLLSLNLILLLLLQVMKEKFGDGVLTVRTVIMKSGKLFSKISYIENEIKKIQESMKIISIKY